MNAEQPFGTDGVTGAHGDFHRFCGIRVESAGVFHKVFRRDKQLGLGVWEGGNPLEPPQREPEPVGGGQRDVFALDLHVHAGEHGQRVILAGRGGDLGHRVDEQPGIDRARDLGERGQGGVVVEGNRREFKPGGTAFELHCGAIHEDLNRFVWQSGGDVGDEFARDSDPSWLVDLSGNPHLGGHFVVESGEFQAIVVGGDEHCAENRLCRLGR